MKITHSDTKKQEFFSFKELRYQPHREYSIWIKDMFGGLDQLYHSKIDEVGCCRIGYDNKGLYYIDLAGEKEIPITNWNDYLYKPEQDLFPFRKDRRL